MSNKFKEHVKVKIIGDCGNEKYIGKTGLIIKDAGLMPIGNRKLYGAFGEGKNITRIQQWLVKLDDTGDEVVCFEAYLAKIT